MIEIDSGNYYVQKNQIGFYEFVFIFSQNATEQSVRATVSEYTSLLRTYQGEITKTEFCGMRTFAYPIKKTPKGYYVLLNVKVAPSHIEKINKKLFQDTKILRHMVVKVDELDPKPSALLQQRHNLDVAYKTQIRSGKFYEEEAKQ